VLAETAKAIESPAGKPACDTILFGLSLLLDRDERARLADQAAAIVCAGHLPVIGGRAHFRSQQELGGLETGRCRDA
jgi:hypothetical protein